MATKNVSFIAGEWQTDSASGVDKVEVKMISSQMPRLSHNDLLTVLHRIRTMRRLQDQKTHRGFDYTLDFALEPGFGFPYVLDFELEDNVTRDIV